MAANKRTKLERERDFEKISKEYLRGHTQHEMAQSFGVSQVQISYDLKILQKRWLESSLVNFDQARAKELAKIDALERTCYEAWDRSLVEKETKTAEKTTGGESERLKAVSRHEQRDGNPAYLAGVQWCIDRRCKLLGLDAPAKHELTGADGDPLMPPTSTIDLKVLTDEQFEQFYALVTSGGALGTPTDASPTAGVGGVPA